MKIRISRRKMKGSYILDPEESIALITSLGLIVVKAYKQKKRRYVKIEG